MPPYSVVPVRHNRSCTRIVFHFSGGALPSPTRALPFSSHTGSNRFSCQADRAPAPAQSSSLYFAQMAVPDVLLLLGALALGVPAPCAGGRWVGVVLLPLRRQHRKLIDEASLCWECTLFLDRGFVRNYSAVEDNYSAVG